MRGDLAAVKGVSDIDTDIANRKATFKYSGKAPEIKEQLDKLAQTNDHMAGLEIVSGI